MAGERVLVVEDDPRNSKLLRAPLLAIRGFTTIVEEDHAGEMTEEERRSLGSISESARRMSQLIDDLPRRSRAGSAGIRHDRVDVGTDVRAAWASLEAEGATGPASTRATGPGSSRPSGGSTAPSSSPEPAPGWP